MRQCSQTVFSQSQKLFNKFPDDFQLGNLIIPESDIAVWYCIQQVVRTNIATKLRKKTVTTKDTIHKREKKLKFPRNT